MRIRDGQKRGGDVVKNTTVLGRGIGKKESFGKVLTGICRIFVVIIFSLIIGIGSTLGNVAMAAFEGETDDVKYCRSYPDKCIEGIPARVCNRTKPVFYDHDKCIIYQQKLKEKINAGSKDDPNGDNGKDASGNGSSGNSGSSGTPTGGSSGDDADDTPPVDYRPRESDECETAGGAKTSILGEGGCFRPEGEDAKTARGGIIIKLLTDGLNILTVGVGILGVIGITLVGLQYLTAGGSEEKTRKAKTRMLEIVIGLVAYALIYAILKWLLPTFGGAST